MFGVYAKEIITYLNNDKKLNYLTAHDSTLWSICYMLFDWDEPYPSLCDHLIFEVQNG